jgi:hypothetical protein
MKSNLNKLYSDAGIDSAVFNNTLKYYSSDPELWNSFFTEAEKYLEKRKASM